MAVIADVKESPKSYTTAVMIQEEKKKYMNHNQLFRELIYNFFVEFLEVFFTDLHAGIDFSSENP